MPIDSIFPEPIPTTTGDTSGVQINLAAEWECYPDCWRDHLPCAVRMVEHLYDVIDKWRCGGKVAMIVNGSGTSDDRLATWLEEAIGDRDRWHKEAQNESRLVKNADAALRECKRELVEAQQELDSVLNVLGHRTAERDAALAREEKAQREREKLRWICTERAEKIDEARATCTELYELWDAETITKWYWHAECQAVRESRDEIAEERDEALATCTELVEERDRTLAEAHHLLDMAFDARMELADITAEVRPVVEAVLAEQRVNVMCDTPVIRVKTFPVDLSKGTGGAGVCRCGAQTHNGVCPNGCYPKAYSEQP